MNKQEIIDLLQQGVCNVTFTKVNGETRTMPSTLKSDLLPAFNIEQLREDKKTRRVNEDNVSVWCTDKQQWRSFKVANVTEVVRVD
jgi:hypothetical protein